MRVTIFFGGTNKERLVSVASAQALCQALPEAGLWFWAADDSVHETDAKTLVAHARPFVCGSALSNKCSPRRSERSLWSVPVRRR